MRPVALAGLVATGSVSWAQDADTCLCSTAQPASVGTLTTVVEACGRTIQRQNSVTDRAKMLRYRGIALSRSGDIAVDPASQQNHTLIQRLCRARHRDMNEMHRTDDAATKLIHDA